MNFELKVQAPKNAPVVWNYAELKANLETALADYQNRVYTEDMLPEAKEDRAKLNKLKKAINDERIAREKEYMKPFNEFKTQAKEICDMIETASSGISEQLDSFEQKRIEEKTGEIQTIFEETVSNYPFDFLTLDKVFNEKWLNKSTSDKVIAGEITAICEKVVKDMEVIKRLPNYSFEATEVYKTTLDLNKALEEGERIADMLQKKRQVALEKAQEQIKETLAGTFEVAFKCKVTPEQARALSDFCQSNGIVLKKIKEYAE